MIRLLVLDRDGVINHDSDAFVKCADEWRPIEGSAEAIARLTVAGFTIAVASNQSGLARQLFDEAALSEIHVRMRQYVEGLGGRIDKIVFCPHLPDAGCDCRKPKPGLLHQLALHYGVPLQEVPVVGDSERDLLAAAAAGGRPLLVLTGNGKETLAGRLAAGLPVEAFDDLAAVADALLGKTATDRHR